MRISDWSSDVCSSDLHRLDDPAAVARRARQRADGPAFRHALPARRRQLARLSRGPQPRAQDRTLPRMAARGDGKGSSPAPRGAMAAAAMSFTAVPLTLYPDMFPGPLGHSMAGRALESGLWSCAPVQIRDFADRKSTPLNSIH